MATTEPPAAAVPYADRTLTDLLNAFASGEPVPGGGSAGALAGAVGVSLLIMVAGLPKTRTRMPDEAIKLAEAAARLRPLRDRLTSIVQRDSDAYTAVLAAMRLPRRTDAERQRRGAAVATALEEAIEAPLDAMRCCRQALREAVEIAASGNRSAATDTATGVELLCTAVRIEALNVDVNLQSVSDAAFASRVAAERSQLAKEADGDATHAMEHLGSKRPSDAAQ